MNLLDKEPVRRVEKFLKDFDKNQKIIVLNTSARTALEAATSLGCEVGAIVKSLLFKTENNFTLCLVAGDNKASLNKIKKLPPDTKIYCGHEYTKSNLNFCLKYDSKNAFLKEKEIEIQKKLSSNQPTIPTTIGQEIKTNIF